jgi:hypothetical protein
MPKAKAWHHTHALDNVKGWEILCSVLQKQEVLGKTYDAYFHPNVSISIYLLLISGYFIVKLQFINFRQTFQKLFIVSNYD